MEQSLEEIVLRIMNAFKQRALPEGEPIFISYSVEVDTQTFERLIREKTKWFDFPHDVLCDNPIALAFMTPVAFAWFLPAYMVVSVAMYSQTDTLTGSIINCLTPPDEADALQFEELVEDMRALGVDMPEEESTDCFGENEEQRAFFMERAALLTQDEKAAVRDYLEYINNTHGADFPVFGPKEALDRYWKNCK